ncbi:MAG: hypothetical protein OHK0048_03650 [Rhodoferax sp.]
MSSSAHYRPLPKVPVSNKGCALLGAFNPPSVQADSPALTVMTDLSRVPVATIRGDASLDDANRSMITRGVRLLMVVDDTEAVVGLVSAADILGERPVQAATRRQVRRAELQVCDVMTPLERMEALRLSDVRPAQVGHVVATLKADGRAHAIVIDDTAPAPHPLVGIFSAAQIARQLGVQIQTHEMARTFAEIEALIAGV